MSAIESRVAGLEVQVGYLGSRLDKIENKIDVLSDRVTRIEERITHLPSKEMVVKIALGTVTAMTLLITFQAKIQLSLGLAH